MLRCYSGSADGSPASATAASFAVPKPAAASNGTVKPKKIVEVQEAKPVNPQPKKDDPLYNDLMGGLFDGACDEFGELPRSMPFGGDAGWDKPNPKQGDGQRWGYTITNENEGVYHPTSQQAGSAQEGHGRRQSRSRAPAHGQYRTDWSYSDRQRSQERGRSTSYPVKSSFNANGKNYTASVGGFASSPTRSANNVEATQGRSASQAPVTPGGPAVVINVSQPAQSVGGWGGIPPYNPRVTSPTDNWATEKAPFDYGAADHGPHHGWTKNAEDQHGGKENWGSKPGLSGTQPAWEPQPANSCSPVYTPYPGLTFVNGKWKANSIKDGWASLGGQAGAETSHQRNSSGGTILRNRKMPGGWEANDDQNFRPSWQANNSYGMPQATDWAGAGHNVSNDAQPRPYGSDSSSNDKPGGWEAKNNNQNAATSWSKTQLPPWRAEANNAAAAPTWDNKLNHNLTNSQNNQFNSQQASNTTGQAFHNIPTHYSPLPSTPVPQQTSLPGAWGQQVTNPPPEPAPLPPPRPSPPLVTTFQQPAPAAPPQPPKAPPSQMPSSTLPTNLYIKPYWSVWNKPPSPPAEQFNTSRERAEPFANAYLVNEDPLYSIPDEIAAKKQASHQVQPGPGAMYAHKVYTPQYMDSMEEPYAVFLFEYRSKGASYLCHMHPLRTIVY